MAVVIMQIHRLALWRIMHAALVVRRLLVVCV